MKVTLVLTCWNGEELLKKNLPQVIKAFQNPKNQISEIIVVDDGSTDQSVDFLKNYPAIKVIEHRRNLGYGAVCNCGVEAAEGELVAILNLDVIPRPDFLAAALPHFKDEKVFAVTFNEGKFGPGKLAWENGFLEIVPTDLPRKTSLTDWANGGSSVFRKSVWQALGGMDKAFLPFYYEDVDLSLRAARAGFRCLWEPKAQVEHQHQSTINPQNFEKYHHRINIELIKERNFLLLVWKNLNLEKLPLHLFFLVKRCFEHPGYLKVIFSSLKRLAAR